MSRFISDAIAYWTADELLDAMAPALVTALDAGERVVYLADDLPKETIASALRARGIDVDAASASGRLEITTASEVLFPGGSFDATRALARLSACASYAGRRLTGGCGEDCAGIRGVVVGRGGARAPVRLAMEMTYLLADVPAIELAPALEAQLQVETLGGVPFTRVCAFNAAREVTDTVADVLRLHPFVRTHGMPLPNPYYRPWRELHAVRDLTPLPGRGVSA